MWRTAVVIVVACVGLSCFSTRRYDAAHAARVSAIDREYGEMEADALRRAAELRSDIDSLLEYVLPVKPGAGYSPATRLWDEAGMVKFRELCLQQGDAPPDLAMTDELRQALKKLVDDCFADFYKKTYLPALASRYYRGDVSWVAAQWTKGADLEALFLYSHNTEILREVKRQRGMVDSMVLEHVRQIRALRTAAVTASLHQRNQEVAAARAEHRAKMMAVANALQAMSQSQQQTSSSSANRPVGCMSDFECSYGWHCLKNNFSTAGVCARSVNAYGNQTFEGPRGSSVGPKMPVSTDCKGLGDCPIGFSCDLQSGACIR